MPNDQLWASSVLCPCHQVPRPAPKPQTSHMSPSSPQGLRPQPARPPVGPSPANLGVLLQPTKCPPPGRPWDSARSVQCWSEVGARVAGCLERGSDTLALPLPFKALQGLFSAQPPSTAAPTASPPRHRPSAEGTGLLQQTPRAQGRGQLPPGSTAPHAQHPCCLGAVQQSGPGTGRAAQL